MLAATHALSGLFWRGGSCLCRKGTEHYPDDAVHEYLEGAESDGTSARNTRLLQELDNYRVNIARMPVLGSVVLLLHRHRGCDADVRILPYSRLSRL